jgi:predicted DNA-binding protein
MTQTISFRPDERTKRELLALTRGRNTSEVLRELIHKSYLEDLYAQAIADAERLRGDPQDRAELAAIAEEMDEIRAW